LTYEDVAIDAESENHVEEFKFDETRVFECLQYTTNKFSYTSEENMALLQIT